MYRPGAKLWQAVDSAVRIGWDGRELDIAREGVAGPQGGDAAFGGGTNLGSRVERDVDRLGERCGQFLPSSTGAITDMWGDRE
jgi:hypothetical protein